MSDGFNWNSAFSDDSLGSAVDKAKSAKQKVNEAKRTKAKLDKFADEVTDHLGDDEVETTGAPVSETQAATGSSNVGGSAPSQAANISPAPTPTPSPPTPRPSQATTTPPAPAVHQNRPQQDDHRKKGAGFPWKKLAGAVGAILPLLAGAFFFFTGGGDGTVAENICEQARERLESTGVDGVLDESLLPEQCQVSGASETSTAPEAAAVTVVFPEHLDDTAADGAAGFGCSPDGGQLPDGVWFGIATELGATQINFDLLCAFRGEAANAEANARGETVGTAQIYATNVDATVQQLPIAPDAMGWPSIDGGNPTSLSYANYVTAPIDEGDTQMLRVWVYLNDGLVTEVATVARGSVTVAGSPDAAQTSSTTIPPTTAAPTTAAPATTATPATSAPVLANATCTTAALPQDTEIEVANVPANDRDGGLNIRQLPDPSSPVLGTFINGTDFAPTGGCDTRPGGSIWWEVTGQGITGWANASFFEARG